MVLFVGGLRTTRNLQDAQIRHVFRILEYYHQTISDSNHVAIEASKMGSAIGLVMPDAEPTSKLWSWKIPELSIAEWCNDVS